jgi:hypothetical protein
MCPLASDDVASKIGHGAAGRDGVDVHRTEQAAEAVVAAWFTGSRSGLVRGSAKLVNPRNDADTDKVCEAAWIRGDFSAGRACAEDRDADGVFSRMVLAVATAPKPHQRAWRRPRGGSDPGRVR